MRCDSITLNYQDMSKIDQSKPLRFKKVNNIKNTINKAAILGELLKAVEFDNKTVAIITNNEVTVYYEHDKLILDAGNSGMSWFAKGLFQETEFTSIDLTDTYITSKLNDTFRKCKARKIKLGKSLEPITSLSYTFSGCKLQELDFGELNLERLQGTIYAFSMVEMETLDLTSNSFKTLVLAGGMFNECKIKNLKVDFSKSYRLSALEDAFNKATIDILEIKGINSTRAKYYSKMFYKANINKLIIEGDTLDLTNADVDRMFAEAVIENPIDLKTIKFKDSDIKNINFFYNIKTPYIILYTDKGVYKITREQVIETIKSLNSL